MKKMVAIALAICLVVIGIMAGPVFAKADKVNLEPRNGELGSGFVIGNSCQGPLSQQIFPPSEEYYKGAGLLRISVKGAEPNAQYGVFIWYEALTMWLGPVGILETNAQGNGNFIGEKLLGVPPGLAEVEYALFLGEVMKFEAAEPVVNFVK